MRSFDQHRGIVRRFAHGLVELAEGIFEQPVAPKRPCGIQNGRGPPLVGRPFRSSHGFSREMAASLGFIIARDSFPLAPARPAQSKLVTKNQKFCAENHCVFRSG
jgi:hypothetical protein